jgi:UPF0176 protein
MISVAAFYSFSPLAGLSAAKERLLAHLSGHDARGIVLLAPEGINGTIAAAGDMDAVMAGIEAATGIAPLPRKLSRAEGMPFKRLKVRIKKEIVTIGDPTVDPRTTVGTYVAPRDWNALISAPDVVVIDTRNSFEHAFGTFDRAVDPGTAAFGDFPTYVRERLSADKTRRIAMFCTGGIRCEKATSFLKREGFENVFHLEGGILKYLEDVPADESLWRGGCFVFDERVALTHGLQCAGLALCHACDAPLDDAAQASPAYEEGVSCARCHALTTPEQKASARERQRQIARAQLR